MRRRELIFGFSASTILCPGRLRAQARELPVIGFLHSGPASSNLHLVQAFRRGIADAGYIEGRDLTIECRWAEGQYDRLAGLAADLVLLAPAVILAGGPPAALAAKAATTTIPIVFVSGDDPIKSGLVERLNRPGGNVTGMVLFSGSQLGAKQVELLHEMVPAAAVVGLLVNPTNATQAEAQTQLTEAAAHQLGLRLQVANASTESDFAKAFATLADQRVGALIVGADPFFTSQRDRLVALAARQALPAVYNLRQFVAAGGLMSYGNDITDAYRQSGTYTVRILGGRAAWRFAGPAADQVRAGDQSDDREDARPHRAALAAGAGQRGHRIGEDHAVWQWS
ncbi:MAG: ABC transporter substrate-binding protein [Stellaceae bacterium]